ncbi:YkgJ family cysteine cluster protein [Paucidesulfovibrio longus]|uniref:YkgJ family cysteine cluster protein n=1 Tax=Paucidesulfovibrio longus TaxID=889 RepID=UPI0003B64ACF|nr:YkgJ family cysteine cluster protein [Paucidesulfovibrio longus]
MIERETTTGCRRCGICCGKGGPALHDEDAGLVGGVLPMEKLTTLRVGEMVYDQPLGKVVPLVEEIIKIRSAPDSATCIFFDEKNRACGIYENRPVECRAQLCENDERLKAVYDKERIGRRDLLPEGHPLLELIEDHDERCSPRRLTSLARRIAEGDKDALEAVGALLAYDAELRKAISEKSGISPDALEFLLGRSLDKVLAGIGLEVRREDGRTVLRRRPVRI